MAKMTAEAEGWELRAKASERRAVEGEKRTTEAVKRAAEAEKRAAEDLEKYQKWATEIKEMTAGLLVRSNKMTTQAEKRAEDSEKRATEAEKRAEDAEKRAAEAEEMAAEAEKRAAEAEEMAELAVINGSNGECFERFKCPITQRLIKDPVITCDGHTYEREAIEKWFVMNDTSPFTGVALDSKVLVPNHAVRKAIEAYVPPIEVYVPPHRRGW
tara:strand:+ start:321 stop:962 length:642 start_codon:yes stop_codon:yes gene_type:complete